ncbi:hypothetical protein AYI69_g2054 [Smittium culicis]|uniref:Endonuclease/exonuclease/phosphatase domain-containing protein n=1 Tax=Smittium culicis TaxID=133412 RepID=A0A1R1XWP5_9FUNG|nr:hypothetical protein AYI69_g6806 [Smittium culicis]OMJ28470.1 hypothetical protein AYI69_g2054 [Smittium culicis]
MNLNNFLPSRTPSPPGSRYEEDYDNQTHPLTSTSMRSDGKYEHGMDRVSSPDNGGFPKLPNNEKDRNILLEFTNEMLITNKKNNEEIIIMGDMNIVKNEQWDKSPPKITKKRLVKHRKINKSV